MRWAVRLAIVCATLLCSWPQCARADVERFALIVGDNKGTAGDTDLHYAEADASKLYDVLKDLGGFEPADMVLLRGENSATAIRTLIALNDRIRTAISRPGTDVLLFVYFSGHADSTALHMSGSRFDLSQLEQLVRGSAATFRILMLDACRSGALTRVKGGQTAPPFSISVGEHLTGEGLAFLTSSSANEDAQE
ncbi:MAG: caspase family protein, partial [Polyangiaceae bacterium]